MNIRLHPHAKDRLTERGATENEGLIAVREGERYGTVYGIDRLDANEQLQSEAGGIWSRSAKSVFRRKKNRWLCMRSRVNTKPIETFPRRGAEMNKDLNGLAG
jgi:hypothetical protein